jgi:hypothetical protein
VKTIASGNVASICPATLALTSKWVVECLSATIEMKPLEVQSHII